MSDKDKTMSDDLAERLRDRRVCSLAQNSCRNDWICEQAADRIEELEERLKAATDDAKEAEAYAGELESVLESIKAKLARSERANEALEQLRPVWAQGWTDDSMAAQASVNALSELWAILGAKDQTQAVSALTELKGQDDE